MQGPLDIRATAGLADVQAQRLESLAQRAGSTSRDVPEQFSKLLATLLVKEMRQALPEGFFGGGAGSDVFDGWLDEHLGAALAERDGLRLEDLIAQSMRLKAEAAERDSGASAGEGGRP